MRKLYTRTWKKNQERFFGILNQVSETKNTNKKNENRRGR